MFSLSDNFSGSCGHMCDNFSDSCGHMCDNFSGSCGHMCNEQSCVLRTSLSLYNFGRRFLGCSRYKVGPKCPFFVWVDNLTCPCGNETAHLALEKMSKL